MNQHTPGPWEINKDDTGMNDSGTIEASGIVIVPDVYGRSKGEADANACVIVASPDLLRALEDAQLFIHTLLCATPDEALDFLTNNGEQVEHDCRMAMRKAKGQEVSA